MKTITALGFLLLASQQEVSAQTLPFYDLSYYDSPECAKALANRFEPQNRGVKADELISAAVAFCGSLKLTERDSRPKLEKLWKATSPNTRFRCIAELAEARRNGRADAETYVSLKVCIKTNK